MGLVVMCLVITEAVVQRSHAGEQQDAVEKVVTDWEYRRSRLPPAIKVVFEGEGIIPKGMTWLEGETPFPPRDHRFPMRTSLLIDFEGPRVRGERRFDVPSNSRGKGRRMVSKVKVNLYDGGAFQEFFPPDELRRIGSQLDMGYDLELQSDQAAGVFFSSSDDPFFVGGYFMLGLSIERMVQPPNIPIQQLQFRGSANLHGREHVVLRTDPGPGGHYYEFYVDPSRRSAIGRLILFGPDNVEDRRIEINEYQLVDGDWLPNAWTWTGFLSGQIQRQNRWRLVELDLKPALRGELFRIEPKPGMRVLDAAADRIYEMPHPEGHGMRWIFLASTVLLIVAIAVVAFLGRGRFRS